MVPLKVSALAVTPLPRSTVVSSATSVVSTMFGSGFVSTTDAVEDGLPPDVAWTLDAAGSRRERCGVQRGRGGGRGARERLSCDPEHAEQLPPAETDRDPARHGHLRVS